MAKMTDEEIAAVVRKATNDASSLSDTLLSAERTEVLKYLRGEEPKPVHRGDSRYVSRDVYDAVDSMRATILETFSAHQRIVQFKPESPQDTEGCQQATDYCRFVVYRDNPGEDIFYDVLTDGLTSRYGVVKVSVEDRGSSTSYDLQGLTGDELDFYLSENPDVGIEELETDPDTGLFFGRVEKGKTRRHIVIEAIPPEELIISKDATSIAAATLVGHVTLKTRDDLKRMGFEADVVDDLPAYGTTLGADYERSKRFMPVNGDTAFSGYSKDTEYVELIEAFMVIDADDTGAALWRFLMVHETLLDKSKVPAKPFAMFVPLPVPHTWFGENFAKNLIPVQNARTVLVRQIINHTVVSNNPRWKVLSGTVPTASELMDNRLGGLVNVRRMDGVAPLEQHPLNPFTFELIRLLDEDKEETTGISKLSQGLNKDAISSQNAQGMVEQLISASQQRQKIIARRFGKFLRELYLLVYDTAVREIDQQEITDVTGTWHEVNPTTWIERKDCSVELALGYGELERESMRYMEIDQYLRTDPALSQQYGPTQRYEVLRKALEKRGIPNVEAILLPPDKAPPPQPDPAAMAQLANLQAQAKLTEAQAQATIMKERNAAMKLSMDMQKMRIENGLAIQEHALDIRRFEHEKAMDIIEARLAQETEDKKVIVAMDS